MQLQLKILLVIEMTGNLDHSIKDILSLIHRKEEYLTNNLNLSHKARASIQNEITILDTLLINLDEFESVENKLLFQQHKAILNFKNHVLALESICFIHGIYDLPVYLNRGEKALYQEATEFLAKRLIQTPYAIREK